MTDATLSTWDDFGDSEIIRINYGEINAQGIDQSTLSQFEKDILLASIQIAMNDVAENRLRVHNTVNRAVDFNDLNEVEQRLARKHLYGIDDDAVHR